MMASLNRRAVLAGLAATLPAVPAAAQGRGPGQGPGPDDMRRRWDGMTERQREELMWQRHERQRQRMQSPGTGRTPRG
jgi:hypothetical protein